MSRQGQSGPPLPLKPSESKGSGGFVFQALAAVWELWWRLFCPAGEICAETTALADLALRRTRRI